jgi:predicted transcriptional regulator of viral defense system
VLTVEQMSFQFIKLNPAKFFGFETVWVSNQLVNVATREKTIGDCLDQPAFVSNIIFLNFERGFQATLER